MDETHYYAFGLTMAGISSKAASFGGAENKKKYQNYEYNSDFDLNLYESFYRSHDPQLGRFWQIDPKPESAEYLSPFSAMGNNPILYNDLLGDIFKLSKNNRSQAEDDIKGLAKTENKDYINFENGNVTVNFDGLSKKQVKKILKNDIGLKLINDIATDKKTIMYDVSDYWVQNFGENKAGLTRIYDELNKGTNLPDGIVNLSNSKTGTNSLGEVDNLYGNNDGHLIIHPDAKWEDENGDSKSRSSIVFHELNENFLRTIKGIPYKDTKTKLGSHNQSALDEVNWHSPSTKPGSYTNANVPQPTSQRNKEFQIIAQLVHEGLFKY